MILHYNSEHKSVQHRFEDISLPNFVVLTGKNGSGKTHLLTGIKQNKFSLDDIKPRDILYLNYLDFAQNFQTRTNRTERIGAWDRFKNVNGHGDVVFELIHHFDHLNHYKDILEEAAANVDKPILNLTQDDFVTQNDDTKNDIVATIKAVKNSIEESVSREQFYNEHVAHSIVETVLLKSKKMPQNISETEFFNVYQKTVFGGSRILSDLSTAFEEYFRNLDRNDRNERLGKSFLDKTTFEQKYGIPPWTLIRNIFSGFGLHFDVNDPIQEDIDPYDGTFRIAFKNTERGNREVDFVDLSSGEQILITLVNAIYTASYRQGLPKVILLDEIDSPLNPSVIEKFISYLLENFVNNGITVMVATHSPSTVAFAPEDSIFIVNTKEIEPIISASVLEGINALSEGFITLSDIMNFEKIKESKIIISEGKNYKYLMKAKEFYGKPDDDVTILPINIGGTAQLRTLFDFMRNFNSTKTFIFVFDSDYRHKELTDRDTGARIKDEMGVQKYETRNLDGINMAANSNNKVFIFIENVDSSSSRGIENLFNKSTTINYSGEFDEKSPKNKRGFEKFILEKNDFEDFTNFKALFEFIDSGMNTNF